MKKLFAKGPDGTSEVPVLVLHGKGFNREEATEGGLETIGHFQNEKAKKEDEELRKLYQIFMEEQENKEDTYKDSEFIIPDVRLRNLMLSWELILVQEISVLNVLSKPRIGNI